MRSMNPNQSYLKFRYEVNGQSAVRKALPVTGPGFRIQKSEDRIQESESEIQDFPIPSGY
jgi:hypothetical protein